MSEILLTQLEINALIAGAKGTDRQDEGNGAARAKAVKTYDFTRPDKFSKEQLKMLTAIHEAIARLAGARLTGKLRMPVTFSPPDVSQMAFDNFVTGLTLPTLLFPMNAQQLSGPFLLDLDLGLALAWVDRLLGGVGEMPKDKRVPTSIEYALIHRLVDELIPAIAEGWSQVEAIMSTTEDPHLNPTMLRVAAPSDVVAHMVFEVRYPGGAAQVSLCMPYNSLEPLLPRLSMQTWYSQVDRAADGASRAELGATLQDVEVPITAVMGGIELTVDELSSLKPGDVIRFGEKADHPVRLSVMDQAMAWAAPGRVGDRVALRLLTPMQQLMEA